MQMMSCLLVLQNSKVSWVSLICSLELFDCLLTLINALSFSGTFKVSTWLYINCVFSFLTIFVYDLKILPPQDENKELALSDFHI